jgi:pilus assembly protein CpaB
MASIGQTLFRFTGAVLLGVSATAIDHPGTLFAPSAVDRVKTVPVVVAARDIPEGRVIDRTGLFVAYWPAGTVPAGAYTTLDSLAGRVTRVPIYKGEAMVRGRLAPEGTGPGLEVKLTPGKRAYAVRINDVASLAGMVQPNSRVDVMVILADPNDRGRRVAKVFMSNMRVLAIGTAAQRSEDGRPVNAAVATLEVTPDEAERLAIATAQGQIQLVLRGYGDPDSLTASATVTHDMPNLVRGAGCATTDRPGVIVRDLLRRVCTTGDLKFSKDSAARSDSPRR